MTKSFLSKWHLIALTGVILAGLSVSSCQVVPDGSQNGPKVSDVTAPDTGESKAMTSYPYGVKKAYNESWDYLVGQYNTWKTYYVVDAGNGQSRVRRDSGSRMDTVSEGMGYGMLLAVYFNDQATFDRLWAYVQAHMTAEGLMHWKVSSTGINVSEFYLPVPHPKAWLEASTWNYRYDDDRTYVPSAENPGSAYLKASAYDRKLGSATDADVDIASALIMAGKKWDILSYGQAAAIMIKAIVNSDTVHVTGFDGFIRNGTLWGGPSCWNPSYFAPAWYKLYIQFINNTAGDYAYHYVWNDGTPYGPSYYTNSCQNTINMMYKHMAIINNTSFTYDTGHGTISYRMILPPDWVDTYKGSVNIPKGSDRYYYIDDNKDGKIDNMNGTQGMSFNHYYDSIRVAWRMALDYSWTGDSRAKTVAQYIGNFYKGKVTTLKDGYYPFGLAWSRPDRDMFNNFLTADNGGQWHTISFVSMDGCSSMTMDQNYALQFYNETKKLSEPYNGRFHYYGNTLRLLSLVYMSGNMLNLYQ